MDLGPGFGLRQERERVRSDFLSGTCVWWCVSENPQRDRCSEGGEEGFSDALDQLERQTVASDFMRFLINMKIWMLQNGRSCFFFSGEFDADRASPHVFVAVPVLHGNNFPERSCEQLVQFLFSASRQAVCDMF